MIRKVSAEDIAIRGNGTGLEYMCPTWHFVYIPVFQVSTAKNEINFFNNHILIVAPVTFAPAGAMTPSAEFLFTASFFFFFFFLDLGFTALSRIFHLYRADRSSKVGENRRTRRKTT